MSMKLNNKKFGFTLSEIMVAIVLIGFLATMTMSTVASSVQQRGRLSQFRAAYARMDAVMKSITEDGSYLCYMSPTATEINNFGLNIAEDTPASANSGCRTLTENFVRAMGATRFCDGDAINLGCLPRNYPTGSGCFDSYSSVGSYVLDNGMIITTDDINDMRTFFVDVNGRKGPNKWGQDIFVFSVKAVESIKAKNGTVYVTNIAILPGDVDSCSVPINGQAKSTMDMMKESASFKSAWKESNTGSSDTNTGPIGTIGGWGDPVEYDPSIIKK